MTQKTNKKLKPKLRFPEFRDDAPWDSERLSGISEQIVEKVGDAKLTPVSISAGVGFVSQADKFGRAIAGKQYKNYICLQRGEFAYNKGNSKKYPQGCVYQLKEFDEVAAPNAFICFRLNDGFAPAFFEGLFEKNAHGKQLIKFITSGARSDGLLNINKNDFFSIRFPIPPRPDEQQKIADCLTSIDALISAHERKLAALRDHKTGLMQQLFPQPGETQPRLRFPEFRGMRSWKEKALKDFFPFIRNGFVGTATPYYTDDGVPYLQGKNIKSGRVDRRDIVTISKDFHERQKKSQLQINDILMVQSGHVGECALVDETHAGANCHALIILSSKTSPCPEFFMQLFYSEYGKKKIAEITTGNTIKHILASGVKALKISVPGMEERERISTCLTALDTQIAAQAAKIEALKQHKRGLMQQLFPALEDEA